VSRKLVRDFLELWSDFRILRPTGLQERRSFLLLLFQLGLTLQALRCHPPGAECLCRPLRKSLIPSDASSLAIPKSASLIILILSAVRSRLP
ncbi:melanoma-associated antigen D1-like isoform 3, partial [Corchorus capsularis]